MLTPEARAKRSASDAGMIVGAVAEVLEEVLALGERRLADPLRALAAHRREADRVAVHPQRHEMAADAGAGDRAFGHLGRACCAGSPSRNTACALPMSLVSASIAWYWRMRATRWRDVLGRADDAQHALADGDRDVVGVERALGREQPVAALVLLADDQRLHRGAVEVLAHLHLDQRALLLDDDDHLEPAREILEVLDVERPRAADLEQAHAELVGARLVDAEVVERLAHVEIALADRHDADLRALRRRNRRCG